MSGVIGLYSTWRGSSIKDNVRSFFLQADNELMVHRCKIMFFSWVRSQII